MVNSRETERNSVNTKLKEAQEKGKKSDSEIKSLKSELADANSQCFILAEENERLKKCVETSKKDKDNLLDQLIKSSVASETLETNLMNEISDLKDTFTTEVTNIKAQIEKAMNFTRETSTSQCLHNKRYIRNNHQACQPTQELLQPPTGSATTMVQPR